MGHVDLGFPTAELKLHVHAEFEYKYVYCVLLWLLLYRGQCKAHKSFIVRGINRL